jgi:predicted transposase/invertase (TIGR01784 family)
MELHFIELEKFEADLSHIKTALDRWVSFLKKAHQYDQDTLPKELTTDPAMEKAFLSLNTLSLDKEEREIYDARLKWLRDESASLQKAHEKGKQAGLEEGIEQGIEQGMHLKSAEIAKKMLTKNMPIDLIAETTDLGTAEIEALKKERT